MEVTDLDVLVPDPKKVKLGGNEYILPADLPMEIFLRINAAGRKKDEDGNDDQIAQLETLTSAIAELFVFELEGIPQEDQDRIRQTVERLLKRRGVRFSFELIRNIYKDDDEAAEESAGPPDEAREGTDSNGTKSSTTSPSPTTPDSQTADEPASSPSS